MRTVNEVWEDFRFEVDELIDRKAVHCAVYRDRAEALEAVGLSE